MKEFVKRYTAFVNGVKGMVPGQRRIRRSITRMTPLGLGRVKPRRPPAPAPTKRPPEGGLFFFLPLEGEGPRVAQAKADPELAEGQAFAVVRS